MAQSYNGEPITVKNQVQEVTRQFMDTAPHLGIWEINRNAFQGDGKNLPTKVYTIPVRWYENPKVEKFALWNNNSSMNHFELEEYTDLSSSGKNLSLTDNFGRGEKATMLPYNPNGLVWMSCQDGNVNMITLAANKSKDTGDYQFIKTHPYKTSCGYTGLKTVIRVVDKDDGIVRKDIWECLIEQWPELLNVDSNWTLKIALGSSDDQNTVIDPYNGFAKKPSQNYWAMQIAYKRFFRISKDIDFRFFGSTQPKDSRNAKAGKKVDPKTSISFQTLENVFNNTVSDSSPFQMETVKHKAEDIDGELLITYVYDPDVKDRNPDDTTQKRESWSKSTRISSEQISGVIYKDELYAVRLTGNHTHQPLMQRLGVHTNTKNFTVLVELPNNAPITSDSDRQHLNWKYLGEDSNFSKEKVAMDDFIPEIIEAMPQWYKDAITSIKRNTGDLEDVLNNDLQDMWNNKLTRGNQESEKAKEKRRSGTRTPNDDDENNPPKSPKKKRTPRKKQQLEAPIPGTGKNVIAPKAIVIETQKQLELDYPQLIGKAVEFVEDINGSRLVINPFYYELEDAVYYAYTNSGASDPKLGLSINDELHKHVADEMLIHMVQAAGITIAAGLKRKSHNSWSDDDVTRSLTPEAITIAIDYVWEDKAKLIKRVKKEVDTRMLINKTKEVEVVA